MYTKTNFSGPRKFGSQNFSRNARPSGGQRPSSGQRPGNFRRSGGRPGGPRSGGGRNRFSEKIDYNLFVRKATFNAEKPVEVTHTFADFNFCNDIKKNLDIKNYTTPTPIQDQAMEHILGGHDLIGLANTGTGKTAAFLLPLIDKIYNKRSEKVLIIAPTRELAMQIDSEMRQFSWGMKIFSTVCVGGMPIYKQINNLRRNPNFVIGTPGRLKDLSDRGLIRLEQFRNIVLDEVDRMLDMGFIDDIKELLAKTPAEKQSLFFSATMPEKIQRLVSQFLKDPITIEVKTGKTCENVDQDIVRVRDRAMKFFQLRELLHQGELKKVLIFIETKAEVERLTNSLITEGFKADSIHGDKKQHQRQRALQSFKNNEVNILVATDVAARGLDIDNVSHVINYTVPQTYDDYIHRIGRTGRANKMGVALTFVE